MGQLLRAVLPKQTGPIAQKHREVSGALGDENLQATEAPPHESMGVFGGRGDTPTEPLCSLASGACPRPNGGSRMTGDCHVRFCESRGLQRPRPLTKQAKKASRGRHKGKPHKKK